MLIVLGLLTLTAFAIVCYRVAEARGFKASRWAVIGFLTGIIGLIVLVMLPGPRAPDQEDAQP